MVNRFKTYLKDTATRHYLRVVAFVVLGISVGAILMLQAYPHIQSFLWRSSAERAPQEIATTTTATTTSPFARSMPVSIRIPKINVDTTFETPLGLNEDQSVEVPKSYTKVGWYGLGASPGENGPAVILGHVDSFEGPAVFFSLGQLTQGDKILITRADGTEVTFEVDYFVRYAQEEFPTELVYGVLPYPALRLITCTGTFIKGEQRYTHNLVVYAKMVTEETATSTE